MPVELEVPVRVGGEPVVVAAVQHDGVVVADATLGQQRLELLLVHEVAPDRILQILFPVQLDRAGDVSAVVGGGVLVHLDQHHAVVGAVFGDPVGIDEYFMPAHDRVVSCVRVRGWAPAAERRWRIPRRGVGLTAVAPGAGSPSATSRTQRRPHPAVVDGPAASQRRSTRRHRGHALSVGRWGRIDPPASQQPRRASILWTLVRLARTPATGAGAVRCFTFQLTSRRLSHRRTAAAPQR